MSAPWMPPLPQSHFRVCLAPYTTGIEAPTPMVDGYTADQMRRAQADAARAALQQAAAAMRNELVSATTDQTIKDAARWFATWLEMKAKEITP